MSSDKEIIPHAEYIEYTREGRYIEGHVHAPADASHDEVREVAAEALDMKPENVEVFSYEERHKKAGRNMSRAVFSKWNSSWRPWENAQNN